ncbi:hypothetical protein [Pantoea cypripedii]|nr:hypothetical protein [Pantoea cypripedii]
MYSIATCPHHSFLPLVQPLPPSNVSREQSLSGRCSYVRNVVDRPYITPGNDGNDVRLPVTSFAIKMEEPHSVTLNASDLPAKEGNALTAGKDFTAIDIDGFAGEQIFTEDFIAIDIPDFTAELTKTDLSQVLNNFRTVFSRNLVSVGVSTAVREVFRHGLLPRLVTLAPAAVTTAGVISGLLPIILQLAGLTNDVYQGRQTLQSNCARLANIAMVSGAMAGLAFSSGLAAAAPALISAFWVYVPVRDLCQYFLTLRDNATPEAVLPAVVCAAGAYAVNQTLICLAMAHVADSLAALGPVTANVVSATCLNVIGETVEHITCRQLHASFTDSGALQIDCHLRSGEEITWQSIGDLLTIPIASRSALFASTYANTFAIQGGILVDSVTAAGSLALGYPMFIYSAEHKPVPSAQTDKG